MTISHFHLKVMSPKCVPLSFEPLWFDFQITWKTIPWHLINHVNGSCISFSTNWPFDLGWFTESWILFDSSKLPHSAGFAVMNDEVMRGSCFRLKKRWLAHAKLTSWWWYTNSTLIPQHPFTYFSVSSKLVLQLTQNVVLRNYWKYPYSLNATKSSAKHSW